MSVRLGGAVVDSLPVSIEDIKKKREEFSWSQEKLAKRAGVYQSQVCRIEAGKQGIDISVYFKIIYALGFRLTVTRDYSIDLEVKRELRLDRTKKRTE